MRWKRLFLLSACIFLSSCSCLEKGWRAQESGDYGEAQIQAIRALSEEPRNPEVYRLIATTAISKGSYDSAVKSAEFACSLDGGSEKSERLLRRAYAMKKSWSELCASGLRAAEKGYRTDPAEENAFLAGYKALAPRGGAYGCMAVLESAGHMFEDADRVKAAYASDLARKGKNSAALAIEDTVDDPAVNLLSASKRLYALKRGDEAKARLEKYTSDSNPGREQRLYEAAEVCRQANDWALAAEFIRRIGNPRYDVYLGIALRRSFRTEESEKVFNAYFAQKDRTAGQTLSDIRMLTDEGYAETAVRAYDTCGQCRRDEKMSRRAADLFDKTGNAAGAALVMTAISEMHADNGNAQKPIFEWLFERGYYPQALVVAQRARNLGVSDDIFMVQYLDTLLKCHQLSTFERESARWVESAPAPASEIRTEAARLEAARHAYHRAIELLEPLDDSGKLDAEGVDIYLLSLHKNRDYAKLDAVLDRYRADIDRVKRSEYFLDAEAEKEFMKSINPLFTGSLDDKISGYIALIDFSLEVKKDLKSGYETAKAGLKALDYQSEAYRRIVGFIMPSAQDQGLELALEWHGRYPNDREPLELIGRAMLQNRRIAEASDYYDKWIALSKDKPKAIYEVYEIFARFRFEDAGVVWAENAVSRELGRGNDADLIEVRGRVRKNYGAMLEKHPDEQSRIYGLVSEDYQKLLQMQPEHADRYMYVFSNIGDYVHADAACRTIMNHPERKKGADIDVIKECVLAGIRSGQSDQYIRGMIEGIALPEEVFGAAELLDREQALHLGEPMFKKLLASDKSSDRLRALGYLVESAFQDGRIEKIREYAALYESRDKDNAEGRLVLADISMRIHDWDEALRHLTWLQAMRPDARDVLAAEIRLARKAPDHAGVQKLLATTFDGAEGVFHRLDWISIIFEEQGQFDRALYYAEKAWNANPVHSDENRIRLVSLYLQSGKFDFEDPAVKSHLEHLRTSGFWKADRIRSLAETAYSSGYADAAQLWMKEASAQSPDDIGLKRRKLEMALSSGHHGQIAVSLENAIQPPAAEVIEPLQQSGSVLDIFDAIDQFEQSGSYAMAASALLGVLPEYIESRGIPAARNALIRYMSEVPEYRAELSSVLADMHLRGAEPCSAYGYVRDSGDAAQWIRLARRCPDARGTIVNDIKSIRKAMTYRSRRHFDAAMLRSLEQDTDLGPDFPSQIGIKLNPARRVHRLLAAGLGLEALTYAAKNPADPEEYLSIAAALAASDYVGEAVGYAEEHFSEMPGDDQRQASALAVLLGSENPIFISKIAESMPEEVHKLDGRALSELAAEKVITGWLKSSSMAEIGDVIDVVLKCAAENTAQRQALVDAIDAEISKRHDKVTLRIYTARHAIAHGLYEEALHSLNLLKKMQPDSDYIDRMMSAAYAHLGRVEAAEASLDSGARAADVLSDYWLLAAELHQNSDISIRRHINAARRAMNPRRSELTAEASVLALESGDVETAQKLAVESVEAGGAGILPVLADGFERGGALGKLPEEIYDGTTGTELMVAARVLSAAGNDDEAAEKYIEAARRMPWPLPIYGAYAEQQIREKNWIRAEQVIAQTAAAMPHAAVPYMYRAIYDLHLDKMKDALTDYKAARDRSLNSRFAGTIAAHAVMLQKGDFARQLIQDAKSFGIFREIDFAGAFCHAFADSKNAGMTSLSEKDAAAAALHFIAQNIPQAVRFVTGDEALNMDMMTLAERAGDRSWLNRMAAVQFGR